MPDEPVWGQYMRTMHINGLGDLAMLDAIHALGDRSRRDTRRIALRFLAGTHHLWHYFRGHSVYLQLIEESAWEKQPSGPKKVPYRWYFHHSRYFPSPCVIRRCPQCVTEDQAQHGYSWFRRILQLPGVEWCPTHGTALHLAPSADNVVTNELTFKKVDGLPDLDAAPAFVRRYVMVLGWLCTRQRYSARAYLESWIEKESAEPSIDYWNCKLNPWHEESIVASNAPAEWFAAQFVHPSEGMKRTGFIEPSLGSYNPTLALLTAALTTSDADVAAVIARAQAEPRPRLR